MDELSGIHSPLMTYSCREACYVQSWSMWRTLVVIWDYEVMEADLELTALGAAS